MRKLISYLFLIGLLVGPVSFPALAREPKRLPATAPHVFYDQVITFKAGSAELSKEDKDALRAIRQTMKDKSQKAEQVHVAVWSDHTVKGDRSLPEKDRALAASRIQTLEDYLEGTIGFSYVESYNMAERSNWFAKASRAHPRDVKSLFQQKGAPNNVTPEDFQLVMAKGSASRAVVLVELDPATVTPAD